MTTAKQSTVDLGRIEIKTLVVEIKRREAQIKQLVSRRTTLAKKLKELDGKIVSLGGNPDGGIVGRVKRARNAFSLVEALCAVLKDQPMGIPRIMSALPTIGYRSESPNLRTMVNVALLKKQFFKRVSRGVYVARPAPVRVLARAA